jgi:hypothetical protein
MKQHILSIGKALTKVEQRTINGGFAEECDPVTGPCTHNGDCHPIHSGFPSICQFGCCITPY